MSSERRVSIIGVLKDEHKIILERLDRLEAAVRGTQIDKQEVESFLHFGETFAEPHHEKEEKVLFPALEKKGVPNEGGPIGCMLSEHMAKREYVKNLKTALEGNNQDNVRKNAMAIVALLRDHISKEDNILYPMAKQVLNSDELKDLAEQCDNLE